MKILALELSSGQGSVAFCEDGGALFLRSFANNRKHSDLFFENLQECWKQFASPDVIVVGLGPGSYAGVRIAIATAIGLRAASLVRVVGIASVCAIESGASDYCVIGDARRESFFFARIREGRVVEGPSLHSLAELRERISNLREPIFSSEPLIQFTGVTLAYPSAQRLAEVAGEQIREIPDSQSLEPIYLREPHITVPKTPLVTAIHR